MKPTSGAGLIASLTLEHQQYPILSFSGKEAMNESYSFKLRLNNDALMMAEEVLGQRCQLELSHHQLSNRDTDWPTSRIIPGIITHHRVLNPYNKNSLMVELEIHPQLALLNLSGRPRVYRELTAKEIATQILLQHGYQKSQLLFQETLQSDSRIYPHWVQAQEETDFAFFHRVLAREGVSYFWSNIQSEQETLTFNDRWYLHPWSPASFILAEEDGLTALTIDALDQLQLCQTPSSARVQYRDYDRQNPDRVLNAQAGNGHARVNVLGFGAQSLEHLQHAALYHFERLVMNETLFSARTQNPGVLCGHVFSIHQLPAWIKESGFLLLAVEHDFSDGVYSNRLQFIPKHTQPRPVVKTQNAGQIIHTAVIHSEDDLPGLDNLGQYQYYTHIHCDDPNAKPIQRTMRLSPYGGSGVHHPIGMHFPLQNQAEVLVMYLHNDFNQPILQNSPSNGLNHAPVTTDNQWSSLIKTAWGQYLEFKDQIGKETITLANASNRNRLVMISPRDDHQHILLASERGSIALQSKANQILQSQEITATIGQNLDAHAKQTIEFAAKDIHLQAESYQLNAQTISFESQRNLELSAETIQLDSQGDIVLNTSGSLLQLELPNGDLVLEADDLELNASDALYLTTSNTGIQLSNAGIIMHGNGIQFAGTPILSAPVADTSTQVPPLITPPFPDSMPLSPVRQFKFNRAKVIYPPNWEHAFYRSDDIAYIEVNVKGFVGNEQGTATIVSYHHPKSLKTLPLNPKLVELSGKELDQLHFTLGDKALYLHEEQYLKSPGTAVLRIPYPLKSLLAKSQHEATEPLYVRIDVGDVQGQFYSNALVLLNQATMTIIQDKERPYLEKHAILTLTRSLPSCVRAHSQCPRFDESRFYQDPTVIDLLPIGYRNQVRLKEQGRYQELLSEEFTLPLPQQTFEVSPQSTTTITLAKLMPPIIFDLRQAVLEGGKVSFRSESPQARIQLSEDEINYIKANGNNLTVFIHGYNVEFGHFHKHVERMHEYMVTTGMPPNLVVQQLKQELELSPVDATVYRDKDFFKRQFQDQNAPLLEESLENGKGVCEWIIRFEHNLNRAAGFDGVHYQKFTRCLFIVWPGKPASSSDYIKAVYESVRMGPIVANVFESLKTSIPALKLHVIAHSQGNGVLLHALEQLGESGKSLVDHAIFWQAAIPNDALSDRDVGNAPPNPVSIAKAQEKNPWYCPYAHKGASLFTVLHSQNDNILGPLLRQDDQPEGVSLKEVWARKPQDELLYALLIEALGLKSLYLVANWFDTPASRLFNRDVARQYWNRWRAKNPMFKIEQDGPWLMCAPTLDEQYELLKSHHADVLSPSYRQQVRDGIIKVHALLKERFDSLSVLEKSGYVLTSKLRSFEAMMLALYDMIKRYDEQRYTEEGFLDGITRFLEMHVERFKHTFTLLQTALLLTGVRARPALGYEGPDRKNKFIAQLRKAGKLKNQDTTPSIWCHSDMKIPSPKVMTEVYQEWIINSEKGIKAFGTYRLKPK
ncbi:contractile injection system protein, VgrG/Pvc8 family [Legionella yabuuchiae]|uniref:contractile injection system protein, VgrG/Pvc8 family n=1 Tax=Legionella yabuuchiae TaxID=376727 RepID=UPI001056A0BB|nr:contractile injection system protein, VgrG/Pvc8 family [Legionella yabuuchiae]